MKTREQVKNMVRQNYLEISLQDKETKESPCCDSGCCSIDIDSGMADDYSKLEGYSPNGRKTVGRESGLRRSSML